MLTDGETLQVVYQFDQEEMDRKQIWRLQTELRITQIENETLQLNRQQQARLEEILMGQKLSLMLSILLFLFLLFFIVYWCFWKLMPLKYTLSTTTMYKSFTR